MSDAIEAARRLLKLDWADIEDNPHQTERLAHIVARALLSAVEGGRETCDAGATYETPRDPAHHVRVRGVGRVGDEPRALLLALTERATDDEIRALHDFFSQRPMLAALASPSTEGWRGMESAPKDGATIEVKAVMRVHHMPGAKFAIMPKDWRPDTPQTEWRLTDWREVAPPSQKQAAVATVLPEPKASTS